MRIMVKKWSTGSSVQMPAAVMAATPLHLDQPVDVREEQGKITKPIPAAACDLAALIAGITDENRHQAVETGPPAGQEAW